jgi:hypothetical protein
MLGRRVALLVAFIAAVGFSSGAAVAATHQSAHKVQPPKLLPMKHPAVTNWHVTHHYCHEDGATSTSL